MSAYAELRGIRQDIAAIQAAIDGRADLAVHLDELSCAIRCLNTTLKAPDAEQLREGIRRAVHQLGEGDLDDALFSLHRLLEV